MNEHVDLNKKPDRRPPLVVGLLGGIAAGKSFVGALLGERGATILDADRIAHAQLTEPYVIAAAIELLDEGVLAADGSLDRAQIAARVFGDAAAKKGLEAIIHPRVGAAIFSALQAATAAGDALRRVVVLDVPLLIEAGMDGLADELLFIDTPFATRLERARKRGWTREQLEAREAAQLPIDEKRSRAAWVVPSGPGEGTRESIAAFWVERVAPRLA